MSDDNCVPYSLRRQNTLCRQIHSDLNLFSPEFENGDLKLWVCGKLDRSFERSETQQLWASSRGLPLQWCSENADTLDKLYAIRMSDDNWAVLCGSLFLIRLKYCVILNALRLSCNSIERSSYISNKLGVALAREQNLHDVLSGNVRSLLLIVFPFSGSLIFSSRVFILPLLEIRTTADNCIFISLDTLSFVL